MGFLESLQQEISKILENESQDHECVQSEFANECRKVSETQKCGCMNAGLKDAIKIASDKKFKNCGADLFISMKDFGTEGSSFVKTARNQAGKQGDTFIREFQTNDAFTMVNITLNRPKCFKQVLMEILEEDNWKKKDKALHKPILLFPFLKRKTKSTEKLDEDIECFDDVRVLVLTLHLRNLLEANGHNCHIASSASHVPSSDSTRKMFPEIFLKTNNDTKSSTKGLHSVKESIIKECRQSPYRKKSQGVEGEVFYDEVELDLRKYLEQNEINQGKNGFNKDLKTVTVIKADGELTDCLLTILQLENSLSEYDQNKECSLIAVAPTKRSWETQISCLCWRMLTSHGNKHENMGMCCCGPCTTNFTTHEPKTGKEEVDSISFHEYLRLKSREICEAYKSRYGLEVQGKEWEQAILDVTIACIKFDMLLCPLRNKVSLKVNEDCEDTSSSRDSIFVLYNYSRLCTLLKSYEKSVQEGTYPKLPDIEEVDFSSLREEQEWRLFIKYILYFPMLVDDLGRSLIEIKSFQINPPTNKVCILLMNLTRDLSSYYHQTKVLLEPRSHLYPLMFARIYFVMALKQIMEHAFKLIDVRAPTQM